MTQNTASASERITSETSISFVPNADLKNNENGFPASDLRSASLTRHVLDMGDKNKGARLFKSHKERDKP